MIEPLIQIASELPNSCLGNGPISVLRADLYWFEANRLEVIIALRCAQRVIKDDLPVYKLSVTSKRRGCEKYGDRKNT